MVTLGANLTVDRGLGQRRATSDTTNPHIPKAKQCPATIPELSVAGDIVVP
jgi:hypothetical protein